MVTMRRIVFISLIIVGILSPYLVAHCQPFDLITPEESLDDSLATELRDIHNIERDIGIEKLTQKPKKLEALIEIGELRMDQARLEEAQRFFEMALEIQPDNSRANEGLAMVYYRSGRFGKTKEIYDRLTRLYPLSERLRENVEKVRSRLNSQGEVGLRIHEDNRGITEIISSLEAYYPSFTYPKLSARFRLETWNFEDLVGKTNSRVLASTFEYILSHRSRTALTFAPETFAGQKAVNAYNLHTVTGNDNMHFAVFTGRQSFKENVNTARLAMWENYTTLVLFGEINERARITQSCMSTEISDGNSRRRFDTEVLYFIHRHGVPLLSTTLKFYQANYERQKDLNGNIYPYWTPGDFKGGELTLSWERSVGANWWWGVETNFIINQFRDTNPITQRETGAGLMFHASYRFETGRIHGEIGDTIRDYYRERRLGLYGSFDF